MPDQPCALLAIAAAMAALAAWIVMTRRSSRGLDAKTEEEVARAEAEWAELVREVTKRQRQEWGDFSVTRFLQDRGYRDRTARTRIERRIRDEHHLEFPTLNEPPFPQLVWNGYGWEGSVQLDSWAGFQSRGGPYASMDSEDPSSGLVELSLETEDPMSPPTASQARAYEYLLESQVALRDTILDALPAAYREYREFVDDPELPDEISREEMRSWIGLAIVHIVTQSEDNMACLGFEFGCDWEDEHGLGVMTHRGRILDIGHANSAFEFGS